MNIKMEIICKNFKHKKILQNKIIVDKPSDEFYIIPLTRSFEMESDSEIFKLTFENQLLLLKYSNRFKEILLKDNVFTECVVIDSTDMLDVYLNIHCHEYFTKNVWQSDNAISVNKEYIGKDFIIIPIIEDMFSAREFGEGIKDCHIEMITNEVVLKTVTVRSEHNGNLIVSNNFLLNKMALFIPLRSKDKFLFVE